MMMMELDEDAAAGEWSLSTLPEEIWHSIVLFCDANSLCAVDLTCHLFAGRTEPHWASLAMEEFGIEDDDGGGKKAWRRGLALTQPKDFRCVELTHPPEYGAIEPKKIRSNGSMIIYNVDNFAGVTNEYMTGSNPIVCRDAETLSFMRCRENPFITWNVAICGQEGCEVLVASNSSLVVAHRGKRSEDISLSRYDRGDVVFRPQNGAPMGMIGSENHLLLHCSQAGVLYVFQPSLDIGGPLLSYVTSIAVSDADFLADSALCWASEDESVFGFVPEDNRIELWKLDATTSDASQTQTLDTSVTMSTLAIGQRFIAGSTDDDKLIYILDRPSGDELFVVNDGRYEGFDEEFVYAAQMEVVGDLLITTSQLGNALCIWNMKTGTLLRRYEEAFAQGISEPVAELGQHEACTLLRLRNTEFMGFLTGAGPALCLWAFPDDDRSQLSMRSLDHREKYLVKARRRNFNA